MEPLYYLYNSTKQKIIFPTIPASNICTLMFLHITALPQKSVCLLFHRKLCSFQTFETKTESIVLSIFLSLWIPSCVHNADTNHLCVWHFPAVKQTWRWWDDDGVFGVFFPRNIVDLRAQTLQHNRALVTKQATDIDIDLYWYWLSHMIGTSAQTQWTLFYFPSSSLSEPVCVATAWHPHHEQRDHPLLPWNCGWVYLHS